jgi:hypothetical protein
MRLFIKIIIIGSLFLVIINIGCINQELSEIEKFYGKWEYKSGESYLGDEIIFNSNNTVFDDIWFTFRLVNDTLRLEEITSKDDLVKLVSIFGYNFSENDKTLVLNNKFIEKNKENLKEGIYIKME